MSDLRRATQELPALLANIKRLETAAKALAVEGVRVLSAEIADHHATGIRLHVAAMPAGITLLRTEQSADWTHVHAEYMGVLLLCLYPNEQAVAA